MCKVIIKIDGKYLLRIDEIETDEPAPGWYNSNCIIKKIPILTDKKEEAHIIEGKMNILSYMQRIADIMKDNDAYKIFTFERV